MNKYFKGIRLETAICKVFQKYIEEKRGCKSFLKLRPSKQAPIDFLGRLYDKDNKTIIELAVEVRSLALNRYNIEQGSGVITFPISKLNELMKFWRMEKEVYIVYLLDTEVYFIKWSYYLKHNFEIGYKDNKSYIILPMRSFIYCGEIEKK